jgi:hypothetical protein
LVCTTMSTQGHGGTNQIEKSTDWSHSDPSWWLW